MLVGMLVVGLGRRRMRIRDLVIIRDGMRLKVLLLLALLVLESTSGKSTSVSTSAVSRAISVPRDKMLIGTATMLIPSLELARTIMITADAIWLKLEGLLELLGSVSMSGGNTSGIGMLVRDRRDIVTISDGTGTTLALALET